MAMEGLSFDDFTYSQTNKYLYNGKEMQDEFGLGWYDFQARFYDPAIVRTTTQDPHAENYYSESPYSFMGNNPIVNIDPTGMDWFYYKKESEEEATWNWHKGSEYNHTYTYSENGEEKTGNIALQGSEYLVEYSITGTNDEGASVGTINVFKQQDIVASQDGVFTGTNQYSGTEPADKGTYYMNLGNRDVNGPNQLNARGDNPYPFFGAQKIPDGGTVEWNGKTYSNSVVTNAYGNGRIRLQPSESVRSLNLKRYGPLRQNRGLYLHGKKDSHNWTHGCVCDKSESIFNYLWNNVRKRTPFVIK
jgi:RHS repeat-associated protein